MTGDSDFEDRYEELRSQYVDRLEERVEAIEEMAASLREQYDPETFRELFDLVHRLSGSGETMGFPAISEVSIELEERLKAIEAADSEDWLEAVDAYCRRIREVLRDR